MNFINPDLEFFEENRDCSYFEDQKSDMRYRFLNSCSIEEYQKKLERGWRRFGKIHFVPECKSCTKCVSMRIDVKNFQFSKSQKRVLNKKAQSHLHTIITIGNLSVHEDSDKPTVLEKEDAQFLITALILAIEELKTSNVI